MRTNPFRVCLVWHWRNFNFDIVVSSFDSRVRLAIFCPTSTCHGMSTVLRTYTTDWRYCISFIRIITCRFCTCTHVAFANDYRNIVLLYDYRIKRLGATRTFGERWAPSGRQCAISVKVRSLQSVTFEWCGSFNIHNKNGLNNIHHVVLCSKIVDFLANLLDNST